MQNGGNIDVSKWQKDLIFIFFIFQLYFISYLSCEGLDNFQVYFRVRSLEVTSNSKTLPTLTTEYPRPNLSRKLQFFQNTFRKWKYQQFYWSLVKKYEMSEYKFVIWDNCLLLIPKSKSWSIPPKREENKAITLLAESTRDDLGTTKFTKYSKLGSQTCIFSYSYSCRSAVNFGFTANYASKRIIHVSTVNLG